MKILSGGDQHITDKKPKNRTDKYFDTVINKFRQQLEIAEEEWCDVVVLPGDIFNTFKESHWVTQVITHEIKKHPKLVVVAVAGQHDQEFHNPKLAGTALATLLASGAVRLLGAEPFTIMKEVAIYGASWNEDIPEIITPDHTNILVLHKMIINEKLWAEQEGHTWANHLLMKHKFDLVVSGDNHTQFTATVGKKHLVNMGSMMRSTIAQLNHRPAVAVYDTLKKDIEIIDLICEPFDKVMQIEKATKDKERNESLEAFIHNLKEQREADQTTEMDFVKELNRHFEEFEIEDSIADIIRECMPGGISANTP